MFKLFNTRRKTILFAGGSVFLFFVVALVLSVKTNSQQLQVPNQKDKDILIAQVEKSAEQSLKVVENDDSPLRIVEAKAKEVNGSDFTKLTGKTTDLAVVSSVPEVKLTNTSGKTIIGFIFAIREPKTKTLQTLNQEKISIAPGETYVIKREHFVAPEKLTVADSRGTRQKLVQPKIDSEKYWIDFAGRSDFFVTVGMVYFDDGSKWMIKEGGEIK